MGYFGRVDVLEKKGEVDLVSVADRASERVLVEGLLRAFPGDCILGEEGGTAGDPEGVFQWVLDPLDGTTNFLHGLPYFAVSVGLVVGGEPVAGVIAVPPADEMVVGIVGEGASCNGTPIHVNETRELSEALIATGFPYDRRARAEALSRVMARAIRSARAVRRCGAACLDLVGVAKGVFGGFWEEGLAPWDRAAGGGSGRAGGGHVAGGEGEAFSLSSGRVVATNGHLHAELSRLVGPGAV